MFETALALFEGRPSAFEEALRRFLEDQEQRAAGRGPARSARTAEVVPETAAERAASPESAEVTEPPASPETTDGADPADAAERRAPVGGDEIDSEFRSVARVLEVGASRLSAAQALHREQARLAARQARELAEFARQRPATLLDRPDDEVGAAAAATRAARPAALTSVSEWAVDEVAATLRIPSRRAARLLTASVVLVDQLPATLAVLESGSITWDHALVLVDRLTPLADDVRAEVEARLLARADRWNVDQLRDAARRAVLRADAAAAAQRAVAAIRERRVTVYPGEDGMATFSAVLPTPVALACRAALEGYARAAATPDDQRTLDQRMADCLADLLLRPEDGGPPVQVDLTVVAGVNTLTGGDEPGEIDGHPVPAVMVRELAYALGLLPRPTDPARGTDVMPEVADADADAGAPDADAPEADAGAPEADADAGAPEADAGAGAPDADVTNEEGLIDEVPPGEVPTGEVTTDRMPADGRPGAEQSTVDRATTWLAELLDIRGIAGTGLVRIPEIAVVDEISGQLLALTTAGRLRRISTCDRPACRTGHRPCDHPPRGPGLGPPPPTPGYAPGAALERFVRLRDRRCRFPGCRARAERCDIDHNLPYPAGPTSCDNLCCLCRHHHRLSHQAPGWRMRRLRDGGLEWTTPGGEQLVTRPPRAGGDGDLPPVHDAGVGPPADGRALAREMVDVVLGRPLRAGEEPPPF